MVEKQQQIDRNKEYVEAVIMNHAGDPVEVSTQTIDEETRKKQVETQDQVLAPKSKKD